MTTKLTISIPVWLDRLCVWPLLLYRLWKYGYSYRKIYLGEGEWTILDTQDYYRYGNSKWYLVGKKSKLYAAHNVKANGALITQVRLHREIMQPTNGLLVDHRNGDGLDNRRANLRLATHTQNMHNCRKRKNATSQFIGVWLDKKRKLWESVIASDGKKIFLGRFKTDIEAARAYDTAALKYHKDFARLNFPHDKAVVV